MSSSFERRAFADQLSIQTPEQVALEFPVAGLGSRFVALSLDHLIQFAALVLFALATLIASSLHPGLVSLSGKWFLAGLTFLFFLIIWGYFTLFEAFWHGQTPGKRAMKLRVIKDSGRQITLFEALARNLLRFIDYVPGLYLTGVITILCNRRNKRLGDLAAGTIVVHERTEAPPLLWTGSRFDSAPGMAPVSSSTGPFPADAVARLSDDDLVVIEAFFTRSLDLPLDTREAIGRRILDRMTAKMGVAAPAINAERALEELTRQLRSVGRRARG